MTDSQYSESKTLQLPSIWGKWSKPAFLIGLLIIIAVLPLIISSPYWLHALIITFVYMAGSVSMRTILISGQFPLAHAAFMGIGAYTAAFASKWIDWSPWFNIPLGAIIAGGLGMLFAYPFSRLRALYYAIGSLLFGMAIIYTINAFGKVTGGIIGISGIPPLFQSASKIPYYYFFFLLMIFIAVILYKFEFSRIGLHLKAIAESHLLASSLGINEVRYRIMVVGVGCFFAGLIGASLSHYLMVAAPAQYDFNISFWILMYVLIGGRNSFAGPFVGVIILFLIPEFFRDLKQYSPYLTASILIIITYLMPEGVTGLIKRIGIWYVNRKTRTEEVEIHTT